MLWRSDGNFLKDLKWCSVLLKVPALCSVPGGCFAPTPGPGLEGEMQRAWDVWAACVNTIWNVHKEKDASLKAEISPFFKICLSLYAIICSLILISKAFLLM